MSALDGSDGLVSDRVKALPSSTELGALKRRATQAFEGEPVTARDAFGGVCERAVEIEEEVADGHSSFVREPADVDL